MSIDDDVNLSLNINSSGDCQSVVKHNTVYALDRSTTGLGVVGGVVGSNSTGGGPGVIGICGPPTGSITPTDYITSCYPTVSSINITSDQIHSHNSTIIDTMTPTSATITPSSTPTGPNSSVAMSQLGTVYATKRRRRNGKR